MVDVEESIEHFINAIMWGNKIVDINGRVFIFRPLSSQERNIAHFIYERSLKKHRDEKNLLSSDQLIEVAHEQGIWEDVDENYYSKFDELIQFAKDQKEATPFQNQKRKIDKQIKTAEKKREITLDKRNSIVVHSFEQQAVEDKVKFIVQCSALNMDGSSIWPTQKDFDECTDDDLLRNLVNAYVSAFNATDIKFIRKVARSSSWRLRWSMGRKNIDLLFGSSIRDLDDSQLVMVYWSLVYDSVYNSMNCPPDNIIEDDDRLDEWLKMRQEEEDSKRVNSDLDRKKGKGFYDQSGKYYSHGKKATDHKEVGYVLDGYYDKDGIFRQYTPEEKKGQLERIQGQNSPIVRATLSREAERTYGKSVREEQLRKGRSRMIFGNVDSNKG